MMTNTYIREPHIFESQILHGIPIGNSYIDLIANSHW